MPGRIFKPTAQELKIYFLCLQLIPESLFEASFGPLYIFLVHQTLPNSHDPGYYAGLLTTAYYIPVIFVNPLWGYFSDTYGRKKVLLVCLFATFLSSLLIGMATSYRLVFLSRVFSGIFGSNSTIVKGFIGDIARDQRTRSWGYAMYGSVFGIAGILGPILSGALVFPAKLYPSLNTRFLQTNPFFLICALYSFLAFLLLIATYFYIDEEKSKYEEVVVDLQDLSDLNDIQTQDVALASDSNRDAAAKEPLFDPEQKSRAIIEFSIFNWRTAGPIYLYCCIAFTCMSYYTLLPLYVSASRAQGGLAMSSSNVGYVISICSASNLFVSITNIADRLLLLAGGARLAFSASMFMFIPVLGLFPALYYCSDFYYYLAGLTAVIVLGICEAVGFQAIILLITESQHPSHLGKTHGAATSIAALCRSIAPALIGFIWDWGVHMGAGWSWFGFAFTAISALLGGISAFE